MTVFPYCNKNSDLHHGTKYGGFQFDWSLFQSVLTFHVSNKNPSQHRAFFMLMYSIISRVQMQQLCTVCLVLFSLSSVSSPPVQSVLWSYLHAVQLLVPLIFAFWSIVEGVDETVCGPEKVWSPTRRVFISHWDFKWKIWSLTENRSTGCKVCTCSFLLSSEIKLLKMQQHQTNLSPLQCILLLKLF